MDTNKVMDIIKKKSSLVFTLEFTTSKLLAYIVVISSSVLGYLLSSAEIVIVGLIVGSSLAGVKNISESWLRSKTGPTIQMDSQQDAKNNQENAKDN